MKFAKVLNLVLIVTFILIKAPYSWGFSISRTESYIKKANDLKLAQTKKWLKLGHYKKNIFGVNSSSFRGPFFLHSEGFSSPEKELIETLKAFFTDDYKTEYKYKRPLQCQFLARRNWLAKQLAFAPEDLLPCEEMVAWKKTLSATSASLIFASADLSNPASSFGHTFIKLVNPANAKNKDLIDYGVNYAAVATESDWFYTLRGLWGFYGGVYTMLPYHQKIREYINLEGRDIVEYTLNLTASEVDELINHLVELENSFAPYHFLSDNCSFQLMELFEAIRPELNLSHKFTWWVIPIDTVKRAYEETDFVVAKKHKKSLNTEYLEAFSHLNLLQKKALDEAIEKNRIAADYELSPLEKAEVYETAMRFMAVKSYRTGEDLDDKKYQLSVARTELGPITQDLATKKEFAPEKSHDSSALYLGFGTLQDFSYTSLKFRSAFHDLEQGDMGMVPMSHNNVGTAELRYYNDTHKWTLERATLMHLLNTTPVTQLDKNLSWKARLDILDQWRPDIEYATGYSFELGFFEASRITYMLTARYLKTTLRNQYQAGPEIIFISRLNKQTSFSADLSYLGVNEALPYLRFTAKINYEVFRNFDLQFQANDQKDYQLNFVRSFIF